MKTSDLVKGGFYNWKNQAERLVYITKAGSWHQFAKVEEPDVVWCEVLDQDLHRLEATEPSGLAPYPDPRTDDGHSDLDVDPPIGTLRPQAVASREAKLKAADELLAPVEYELKRLQALSVTNVLLDVVPGDGSGHEVFATSVNDVVEKLTEMGNRIEDLEGDLRNKPEIDSNAIWAKFIDLVQAETFKGTPKEKWLPLVNLSGSVCRFEMLFKQAAKEVQK